MENVVQGFRGLSRNPSKISKNEFNCGAAYEGFCDIDQDVIKAGNRRVLSWGAP
jgi:hypothetical protein